MFYLPEKWQLSLTFLERMHSKVSSYETELLNLSYSSFLEASVPWETCFEHWTSSVGMLLVVEKAKYKACLHCGQTEQCMHSEAGFLLRLPFHIKYCLY